MNTQDGYDWPAGWQDERWPVEDECRRMNDETYRIVEKYFSAWLIEDYSRASEAVGQEL